MNRAKDWLVGVGFGFMVLLTVGTFAESDADIITRTWAKDQDGTWNNVLNWTGNIPNGKNQAALLGTIITKNRTVDLDIDVVLNQLRLTSSSATARYLVKSSNAKSITFRPETAKDNFPVLQVENYPDPTNPGMFLPNKGRHVIEANLKLDVDTKDGTFFTIRSENPDPQFRALDVRGSISPARKGITTRIDKVGPGMVIFSRANTYNGETNIRGGNLSVEANGALGVGGAAGPITKVFDGATLSLRAVDYTTVQRLHIQGDGPTVDVGGVLQPFGAIHIPIANSTWSGPISLLGHSTIHIRPSSSLRVNGAIGDGPGAVTPDLRLRGGGTLELAKANNWSGRTIIADGTVTAQVDNALGKGKVVIFKGGTLRFENVNYTRLHQVDILPVQAPQTPPDLMSNAIEGSGISVFRGPISIFGGAANISVQNKAAVLRLDGRIDDVVDPGSIVKVGNGTLVLTTENTYRGGTTVKAGVLELQDSAKDGKTRTGSGDVVLEKGTQLAGNGKVAGKVDASKGGADVRPKAKSAGELTIGRGISFGPESSYTWELDFNTSSDTGGIPGADWSLIRLTFDDPSASLEIDPTAFLSIDLGSGVVIDDPFWTTPHLWKIIDVQSPSINNQFDFFEDVHLFGLDDPRVRTFAWTDPSRPDDLGDVFLEIRGIPEPASWVLGLTGISAVAGWHALRRRRRTRSTRPTELPARSIHHR